MTKKLFVCSSTVADEEAVFDYYRNNPDPNISQRAPEIWRERIASGAATLIRDEQGCIVACAIAYPIMKKTDAGEIHAWTEVGSVHAAMKNMGLLGHLVSALALRAWLLEPPEDRFILDIVVTNAHSKHAFTKAGATLYTDMPDDLKAKVKATLINQKNPLDWYQIGPEALPGFARKILDAADSPKKLLHAASGEEYEVDYSRSILISMFRAALEETAGRDLGSVSQPDMSKGLRHYKRSS